MNQSSRPIPVALWHAHNLRATMAGQTNTNTQAGVYMRELLSVGVALMLVAKILGSNPMMNEVFFFHFFFTAENTQLVRVCESVVTR